MDAADEAFAARASCRSLAVHVIAIALAAMLLFWTADPGWWGAALVAAVLFCAVSSELDLSHLTRWLMVLVGHQAVAVGVVAVLAFTRSLWRALAALAVALLLLWSHQTYDGCVLTHVEASLAQPSRMTMMDIAGLAFPSCRYDRRDRTHVALVTGGVMAATTVFGVVKVLGLAVRDGARELLAMLPPPAL